MKTIIFVLLLFSLRCFSQDTTIATLSIKARLVQTLTPFVHHSDDTAYLFLLHKWVKAYDVASPPSGTTQVSADSIKVVVIAACYRLALSWPQGASSVGDDFKADILAIRNANNYLDRLCDAIDAEYATQLTDARAKGRKILTAKNQ